MSNPSNIIEFDGDVDEFLDEVREFGGLVVVDFFSNYCGPCKKILADLPKIATENPGVRFYKADVDEAEDFSCYYKVSSIPHFKFFKLDNDGEPVEVERLLGPSIEQIKEAIAKHK